MTPENAWCSKASAKCRRFAARPPGSTTGCSALIPHCAPLFKGDMTRQGAMLMSMIAAAVNGLHRMEPIVPAVESRGRRRAGYGVRDEHRHVVGAAPLWTLEQGLGTAFIADVKETWSSCYGRLAGVMQTAAAQPAA